MAVEPQVFICYGRPDKDIAHEIAAEFWRNRIECYNYLSKPVEDRVGEEIQHLGYIYSTRLFIAIISEESISRHLVIEEIVLANQIASIMSDYPFRVHVSLLNNPSHTPFPEQNLIVEWAQDSRPSSMVNDLLKQMGPEFLERNQKAWEINKGLYPEKWEELNERYVPG